MKQLIQSLTGGPSSSAKVVDGKLILSFPDAVKPVLWQMDITQAKTSAMEVDTDADGQHVLVLKTPKGERHIIAPFVSRDKAVKALMAIGRAMESARGQMTPANAGGAKAVVSGISKGESGKKVVSALIALVILIVLLGLFVNSTPETQSFGAGEQAASRDIAPADGEAGVPQSAEEFLRGR